MPADEIRFMESGGVDDTFLATKTGDGLLIEIDNPWWGDSETGFGACLRFSFTNEQAAALAAWLIQRFLLKTEVSNVDRDRAALVKEMMTAFYGSARWRDIDADGCLSKRMSVALAVVERAGKETGDE